MDRSTKFRLQLGEPLVANRLERGARLLPWLTAGDLGVIAARAFAESERFIGLDQTLASDVQTIDECRTM